MVVTCVFYPIKMDGTSENKEAVEQFNDVDGVIGKRYCLTATCPECMTNGSFDKRLGGYIPTICIKGMADMAVAESFNEI